MTGRKPRAESVHVLDTKVLVNRVMKDDSQVSVWFLGSLMVSFIQVFNTEREVGIISV